MQQFMQTLQAAIVSLNGGRKQEALELARQCVDLQPDSADAHLVFGTCLDQLGRTDAAVEHFQRAVALQPGHYRACLNLGVCQMRLKDFAGAAHAFQAAANSNPGALEARHNLACALASDGKYRASLEHFEAAKAGAPGNARVLRDYGSALEKLSRFAEARTVYADALKIDPDYGLVHVRLGHICQVEGDFDGSEQHLRRALAVSDRFPEAYQLLSLIERLVEDDIEPIERILAHPELPDPKREALEAALGRYYDKSGQYAEAFTHFTRANELQAASVAYDPEAHDADIDRLISQIGKDWPSAGPRSLTAPKLIFIVGMPRSGSTLVHQILTSHRDVRGLGETNLVETLVRRAGNADREHASLPGSWGQDELNKLGNDYISNLTADVAGEKVLADKSLENIYYIDQIVRAFPEAVFLYCRRHPMDTCLSSYFSSLNAAHGYACNLDHLVRRQLAMERLAQHLKSLPGGSFHEVSYEELIENPEREAKKLIAHAGLEWDPACLEFHKSGEAVVTSSIYQVRQPLYSSSVNRWKNYESQIKSQLDTLSANTPISESPIV